MRGGGFPFYIGRRLQTCFCLHLCLVRMRDCFSSFRATLESLLALLTVHLWILHYYDDFRV